MFNSIIDRNWRAITAPRGFYLFILGFVGSCFVLRLVLFPGASSDDAEMLVLTQSFEAFYKAGQPPLLNWILTLIFQVTGPSLTIAVMLKGLMMLATYFLLYGAARLVLADPRRAALAAASPLLIYLFVWDGLYNYSHTIFMTMLAAAALFAALRIRAAGRAWDYVSLGLAFGVGLLAKYNFAVFGLALLGAGFYDRTLRTRFFNARILLTLAAGAVVAAPHFFWLYTHSAATERAFAAAFRATAGAGWLDGVVSGLLALGDGIIGFLLPLPLLLVALFPRVVLPVRNAAGHDRGVERFLLVHMAAMVLILVAAVLFGGVNHFRNHYFFIFIGMPIWFFVRLEAVEIAPVALRRYGAVLSLFAVGVILGILGKFFLEPAFCKRCYLHIPYPELTNQIQAAGFSHGTIVVRGQFVQIGGNLRTAFPDARIVTNKFRFSYIPPPVSNDGQCLFVWTKKVPPSDVQNLKNFAAETFGTTVPADAQVRTARASFALAPARPYQLFFILLAGGSGACR